MAAPGDDPSELGPGSSSQPDHDGQVLGSLNGVPKGRLGRRRQLEFRPVFILNRSNPVDHQGNFSSRPGAGQTIEVRMTGAGVYTLYPAFQKMVKDIDPCCPDADDPVFGKGIVLIG